MQKTKPFRSKRYLQYVASQPCFGCGIEGLSQAAHPNYGKGMGLKTSDDMAFPLCGPRYGLIGCHAQLDLKIDMDRDYARRIEAVYSATMLEQAKLDGWFLKKVAA